MLPLSQIEDKTQLIGYLESGCKSPEDWRIGTEHEKFPYRLNDLKPLPYEGDVGIRALLQGFKKFGWEPVQENDCTIAMTRFYFS